MNLVMTGASGVSGRCYTTFLVLARYADDETGACWPGMRAISFMARQSSRTTVWAIDELEKAGWIEIERKGGKGGCNLYTLNLDRLASESVRLDNPRPKPGKKRESTAVEKPVESLRISCGQVVEKQGLDPVQTANRENGIIKEKEEKNREIQKEPGTAAAGRVFSLPVSSPPRIDVTSLLKRLNRSIASDPRARGAPPPHWPPLAP